MRKKVPEFEKFLKDGQKWSKKLGKEDKKAEAEEKPEIKPRAKKEPDDKAKAKRRKRIIGAGVAVASALGLTLAFNNASDNNYDAFNYSGSETTVTTSDSLSDIFNSAFLSSDASLYFTDGEYHPYLVDALNSPFTVQQYSVSINYPDGGYADFMVDSTGMITDGLYNDTDEELLSFYILGDQVYTLYYGPGEYYYSDAGYLNPEGIPPLFKAEIVNHLQNSGLPIPDVLMDGDNAYSMLDGPDNQTLQKYDALGFSSFK